MSAHRALAFAAALVASATVASADPRPFTFSNDTYPMGKGDFEFEHWTTWKHHTDEDAGFNRIDFREARVRRDRQPGRLPALGGT